MDCSTALQGSLLSNQDSMESFRAFFCGSIIFRMIHAFRIPEHAKGQAVWSKRTTSWSFCWYKYPTFPQPRMFDVLLTHGVFEDLTYKSKPHLF